MIDLSGRYFMDGMDIWTVFNVFVESGSDGFLNYPARKDGISHDWGDANGVDYDTSQNFLGPRDITLNCAILTTSEADFWQKYAQFLTVLTQPGLRRFQLREFSGKSFSCMYVSCENYKRFTRILDADEDHKVACKFSITIKEVNPAPTSNDTLITDEDGRFLVT